ncbi:MAG TPA: hypothetical protein DCS15_10570 [Flavobacteriales bacterium]|jgi:hypothetical protein|nr:hypothetical protein [Salibacteraceae bacterium]HAS36919.1 hypothetical protein [Flavobacteriales bacterium]
MAKIFVYTLLTIALLFLSSDLNAQCSMCRAIAESSIEGGSKMGTGLNSGIMYLMGIPYILLVVMGVLLFKKPKLH